MALASTTQGSPATAGPAATINPADFSTTIDNPFSPLEPGTTFVSVSPDGSFVDTVTVTRRTKVIDGVTVVVVNTIVDILLGVLDPRTLTKQQ